MRILNAVIAYKDFEWTDLSQDDLSKFLVFTPNDIKTNLPNVCKYEEIDGYDNRVYGELSHHKYIKSNIDFDWIVTNQYRRRFELPNYKNIYVPSPMVFKHTVKIIYSYYHNIEDLDLMTDIIMTSQLDTSFKIEWLNSLSDDKMICYNMFSGPKDLYDKWINLSCELLDKFKDIRQFTSYEKIVEYYQNKNNIKSTTHEPYRVYGFLWERITNCFFRLYSKQHNDIMNLNNPVFPCKIKLLEEGMVI